MKKGKSKRFNKILKLFSIVIIPFLSMVMDNLSETTNILTERFREPGLDVVIEGDEEIYISDKELTDGVLYLHPQVLIQYNNKVIKALYVEGIYDKNSIDYDPVSKRFIRDCGDWGAVTDVIYYIEDALAKEGYEVFISEVSLIKLQYKDANDKDVNGSNIETCYYILENDMIAGMSKNELEKRSQEYSVAANELESKKMELVKQCVDIIESL